MFHGINELKIYEMKTKELIRKIQQLSIHDRMYVIERSMYLLRKQEEAEQMMEAANVLREDYDSDKELTAFTDLDIEHFYEAR